MQSTSADNLEVKLLTEQTRENEYSRTSDIFQDEASTYDYCMVFDYDKKSDDGLSDFAKRYIRKLQQNGLDTFLFYSVKKSHIFVLIRASLKKLRDFADSTEFRMLLDSKLLKEYANKGDPENNIAPIDILDDKFESPFWPYDMIFSKYRTEIPEELYWKPSGAEHPFRTSIRLKLTQMMIQAQPPDGSQPIKIRYHILKKNIAAFYPLHNMDRLSTLRDKWMSFKMLPWQQPFFDIKVIEYT
jgi:hypothetical protein